MLLAVQAAESIWTARGAPELVITSANDGEHKRGSAHYRGCGLDFRTHNLPPAERRAACQELGERLGVEYDVLFEHENTPQEHCHCEHDPKGV